MNYSLYDELVELQGMDLPADNWHESKQAHNEFKFANNRAMNDFINDHSGMLRGADGKVHTELQEDTMVSIGGMELTYGSAVRAGLIQDENVATHEDEYEYSDNPAEEQQSFPTLAPIPEELAGQQAFAERMAGKEVFESALMGSKAALQELAEKAGASPRDAQTLIDASMKHYLDSGFTYVSDMLGDGVDPEHVRQFFISTAVSPAQKRTMLQSARRGDISGLFGFVQQYKEHYGLNVS